MVLDPGRNCFTRHVRGNVNVIVTFASKIEDPGNVNVPQLLRSRCLLLKLLAGACINALYRYQRDENRLTGSLVYSFVADCRAIAVGLIWAAIIFEPDSVVFEECRALHVLWVAHSQSTLAPMATDSTSIASASCLLRPSATRTHRRAPKASGVH